MALPPSDFPLPTLDFRPPRSVSGPSNTCNAWMEVVILTGHGSIDSAVECTRIGAHSYLQKPCELDQLLSVLADAYKKKVMNKLRLQEKRMNELVEMVQYSSPLAILRRIRELDEEG